MSTLPFFSIPFLPQQEILKNLDFLDVVKFSTVSTRSKKLIEVTKPIKVNNCYWSLNIHSSEEVYIKRGKTNIAQWSIHSRDYKKYFRTVLNLFKISKFELYMDQSFALKTNPVFKYTRTFKEIYISNQVDSFDYIPEKSMEFLMDKLTVGKFQMCASNVAGLYTKPLKHDTLILESMEWMSIDAILNSTSTFINIEDRIDHMDLNRIVRKWQEGGLQKLEELRCSHYTEDGDAMEDIETVEIDPKTRPYNLEEEHFVKEIHDIEGAEGRMATVVLASDRFQMLVWPKEN